VFKKVVQDNSMGVVPGGGMGRLSWRGSLRRFNWSSTDSIASLRWLYLHTHTNMDLRLYIILRPSPTILLSYTYTNIFQHNIFYRNVRFSKLMCISCTTRSHVLCSSVV